MFNKADLWALKQEFPGLNVRHYLNYKKADSVTAKAALTSFSYTASGALLLPQTHTGQELVF